MMENVITTIPKYQPSMSFMMLDFSFMWPYNKI